MRLDRPIGQSTLADHESVQQRPLASFQEVHYTVAEIAKMWKLSKDTIRKIFENEPGVLPINPTAGKGKRGYRTLRIRESVVERVYRRLCNPDLTAGLPRAYCSGSRDHRLLSTADGP